MKTRLRKFNRGYTLIELMLVVTIMGLLSSVLSPKMDILLQKAHQSRTKGNLANLRSALAIYYTENNVYPLANYPEGLDHIADGVSLTGILTPRYVSMVPTPRLMDRASAFNGLALKFDQEAERLMKMDPPRDVYILLGQPAYTPLLISPYAYDNQAGYLYYPNGNYDTANTYFYLW
jgi:prepilin-type N-terminal cleavage/methylation domain-containing protein